MSGSVNFGYVQALVASNTAETTSVKQGNGSEKVKISEDKRKTLEETAKKMQEKIDELAKEIKELSEEGGCKKFGRWMVGSDGGSSDMTKQLQEATAEMKRAQQLSTVEQQKVTQLLQELQGVQNELAERTQQHEKTFTENEATVKN
jgi:uncharacterized coiled-coil DUF342 family protein